MNLSPSDLRDLADVAIAAAAEAGEMIARSRPRTVEHKTDAAAGETGSDVDGGQRSLASSVVTEIDQRSEAIIVDRLLPTRGRFELGLLTEERDDDGSRFTADHFWCIDPLDGTLPFIEGLPGWAVSIALVARDGTPHIGVIHDPADAMVVHAIAGAGAFRDGRAWAPEVRDRNGVLSVFADRSFLVGDNRDALADTLWRVAGDLGLSDVRFEPPAGAVMNALGVLRAPPACYVKVPKPVGGGSLWDFAATACVFAESGAVATDIHGEPLDLNRAGSTFMNHRGVLFATDPDLAGRIRAHLADRG